MADMDDIQQSIDDLTSSVQNASDNLWEIHRAVAKESFLNNGDVLGIQAGVKPLVEVIEKLIIAIEESK